ncbi:MAG: integration host factor subunit beta [Spirochaetes bacterium]|nr:integration host factor subunit beta [Spirochaetota bacterium]
MIKADIVSQIQNKIYQDPTISKSDFSQKSISMVIDHFFDVIKENIVAGNRVELRGFGVFDLKVKEMKKTINPKTKEVMLIEKHSVPVFRPGQGFKSIARESFKEINKK